MRFDIITIFPEAFASYLNASILKRAQARRLIRVRVYDLRKFTLDKHRTVDDKPYGGGPGMVVKLEPLARAISSLKLKVKNLPRAQSRGEKPAPSRVEGLKVILLSASGKQFSAKMARDWAKRYNRLILIAGHYEGVDERIRRVVSDFGFRISDLSIGPYVLTGGELPAMVVIDAVARHIPGVLGKEASLEEKRYGVGVPMYTRPEIFKWRDKTYRVPKVLRSGDHKKIDSWRRRRAQ